MAQKNSAVDADKHVVAVQTALFKACINREEVTVFSSVSDAGELVYMACGASAMLEIQKSRSGTWSTTGGLQDGFVKAIGHLIDYYKN